MYRKGKRDFLSLWFYVFLGGVLLGIVLMNIGREWLITEEGIFSTAEIGRLKYLEIDSGNFFLYVLKKRLKNMLILVLLSTTVLGNTVIYGSLIWQGVLAGMTITAAMIRFGIKGMLFIVVSIFPHQFLLFPAMIMLLIWCYDNCAGRRTLSVKKSGQYMGRGLSMFWIVMIVFVGCLLESYVNQMLVSDMLKIF